MSTSTWRVIARVHACAMGLACALALSTACRQIAPGAARPAVSPPGRRVLTIGVILPLTGAAAQYGQNCKKGIELAVTEVNQTPGTLTIRTIVEDDRTEPKDAVAAFTKLATVDKVPLVIGPLPSSNAMAVAPLANEDKVVLFSPGASTPRLTGAGPYVFRNWQSDAYEAQIMARYLLSRGTREMAILAVNNDFGVALADYFTKELERLGGRVLASESFAQDATDFRAQLTKIKAARPRGLYLLSYPRETGNIVKQARQLGLDAPIFGVAAMEDPTLLRIAGPRSEGIVYTKAIEPAPGDTALSHFVSAYKSRYGEAPGLIADTGYDAVNMVVAAARGIAVMDGPAFAASLGRIREFHGASGLMSFDENGDIIKPVGIKQISGGQFRPLEGSPSL